MKKDFDSTLIGLTLEEAYKKIEAAGLQSNLIKNETTGKVEVSKGARIMLLMPDYITVSYNRKRIVTATRRG